MSEIDLAEPFQAELISAAYMSPANFARVRKAINADSAVFSNPHHRWLWDLGSNTVDTNGEIPSPGLIAQEAAASFRGEEYGDLIMLHHDIMGAPVSAPHAVIGRAVELGELHRFKQTTKKVDRLIADGRYAEAKRLVESREWIIEATKLSRFRERRMNHGYDDIDQFIINAKKRRDDPNGFRLSTGIAVLDQRMDGGPALGDMTLLIGWTGRGKSTLAVNMVDAFLRQGKGGLFLPSEMRDELILAKIFARSTHIAQNDIYVYRFPTPEHEKAFLEALELRRQRFKRLLVIEQLGVETMDRESILRAIDEAANYLADFSWLVVDTLDHCKLLPEFKRDKIAGFGANANWVAGVTDELNVASIVTTQSNREGSDRTELQHAANHSEGIRISQNVISINHADVTDDQPDLDPANDFDAMMAPPSTNGALQLSLLKCRFGLTGDIPITTDLAMSYMGDKIMDAYEELGRLEALDDRPLLELLG